MKHFIGRYTVGVFLLVFLGLAACSPSLVRDITPPPQMQSAAAATPIPTQAVTIAPSPTVMATGESTDVAPASTDTTATPAAGGIFTIQGKISNGSGGSVPEGLSVVLQGYDNMQMTVTEETQSTADGSFTFTDVERMPERVFVAILEYDGILFGSDVVHASDIPDNGSLDMTVPIYDHTSDTSSLYADRVHIFLSFVSPEQLQVTVYLLISNPSNMAVAPASADQPVFDFPLPADATNLQFEDSGIGERYVETADGFGDTLEVLPGLQQHEILFGYEVSYSSKRTLDFSFPCRSFRQRLCSR